MEFNKEKFIAAKEVNIQFFEKLKKIVASGKTLNDDRKKAVLNIYNNTIKCIYDEKQWKYRSITPDQCIGCNIKGILNTGISNLNKL